MIMCVVTERHGSWNQQQEKEEQPQGVGSTAHGSAGGTHCTGYRRHIRYFTPSRVDGDYSFGRLPRFLDSTPIGLPLGLDGPIKVEAHADAISINLMPKPPPSTKTIIAKHLFPHLFGVASSFPLPELSDTFWKMASVIQVRENLLQDSVVDS